MATIESSARILRNNVSRQRTVAVKVPATGGELWQGVLNRRLVLFNCPIAYYGEVTVTRAAEDGGEIVGVADSPLTSAAAAMVLAELGEPCSLKIEISCPIPRGLGMASSTTELAATAYATARVLGQTQPTSRRLADQAVRRFDSGNDGNYIPGLHLMDPLTGEPILAFSQVPQLKMLLVNTGGQLATHAMDRARELEIGQEFQREFENSFAKMVRGLALRDVNLIGEAATANSIIYQHITKKPQLEEIVDLVEFFPEIVGINSGHSGTVIGLLSRPHDSTTELQTEIRHLYGRENLIGEFNLVPGGFHELLGV